MKKVKFLNKEILYGDELIGSYRQANTDRYIPEFIDKWDWIYYQFDFYEGENGDELFFQNKVTKIIQEMFNCFK